MEHELGHSDFGIDYARLTSSPKTPKTKSFLKRRIPQESPRGDRFIPNRSAMDMEISHFNLMKENTNPNTNDSLLDTPSKDQYKAKIAESLFQESAAQLTRDAKVRFLRYTRKVGRYLGAIFEDLLVIFTIYFSCRVLTDTRYCSYF
jgi:hypothetical protein